jgi:hypothetical protein
MSDKTVITSQFATPRDVAKRLHIPGSRVTELERLMDDLKITGSDRKVTTIVETKRSAGRAKSRGSSPSTYRAGTPSKKR